MPLGLTGSGYSSGMDKSFDERLRDNKIRQMASAQGKTVKVFLEDRDHYKELAEIESEEQAGQAKDEAARMMDAQGYMPPAKEPTVVDVPSIAAATVETISLVAKAIPTAAAPAPEPPPERFTINGLVFASKSTSDCAETVALSFILAVTELRI